MSVLRFGRNPGSEGRTRSSQVVVRDGMAWVVATAAKPYDPAASAEEQARQALVLIDERLARAGSDKSRIIVAQVLISDMRHFAGLNAAWDAWVDQENPPCRFCCEARLGHPDLKVEVIVQAECDMDRARANRAAESG
jgi:enamine deaminase RidA (YjgF/YER057c/UK114 family)